MGRPPDFSRVHGPGYDPLNHLRAENTELKNRTMAQQQEIVARAAPRIGELMDALSNLTAASAQGHLQAKEGLRSFYKVLDAGREQAGDPRITVIKGPGS